MPICGFYKNLIPAIAFLIIILSITSCQKDKQSESDEMPLLHQPPLVVALNTQEGYDINPLTGDSIQPIINSLGDTVITGVPTPARGKVLDPASLIELKVIPAGNPKVIHTHPNVHKIPEELTVIPVNKASLRTFKPGVDTSSFVLINSIGDTVPTGVPIPATGQVVPCLQPRPIKASAPQINQNASVNMKFLDEEQGLMSSFVHSILEDSRGNIWLTTQNGVSMYNGETFTHFTEKEGLIERHVRSICEDSHGNLWFGGHYGVSRYNGETFTHFSEKEGFTAGGAYVSSILEDSHGNLWFGTQGGGANMYNGESYTHFTEKEGLSNNNVESIFEDSHGNLWFGTSGGGVNMYNGDSFTHFTKKEGLSSNYVSSILEDSLGNLWFGTYNGVSKYNGVTFTHFAQKDGLSSDYVISILKDSHGNLWFGTQGGGVNMYNGVSFTHFTKKEGLSGNDVESICEDSHGNLWFGIWGGGLTIYFGETFRYFTQNEVFSSKAISSILEDSHGNLWFSIRGTGVSKYDGETFTTFTENEGLLSTNINSMLEDSHGNLWFGTNLGMCMYNGETFTHLSRKKIHRNWCIHLLEDSHGNLWFNTYNEGVYKYDGETFSHFTDTNGLCDNYVRRIMEDHNGNLWFGTRDAGISIYDGETFMHLTQKEGLSKTGIRSIMEDSRGNLWFGTFGQGVSIYNGETFTHITNKNGLSGNSICSIMEDSNNNIWLGTRYNGLNRLTIGMDSISGRKKNLSAYNPLIQNYGLQDGLRSMEVDYNLFLDSKNRFWWGGFKCLTMMDMNHLKIPNKPPVMQLNQIDIDGQFIDYRNWDKNESMKIDFNGVARFKNYPLYLELPYNRNHVTFHFTAIDWSAPHKVKYSYKMEGLNDIWSEPIDETKVDYHQLPHGRYTLKIRAIGAAQKWSEPLEYDFRILPPPWLTWWAYLIYGFIVLLLIRWYRGYLIKREKVNADLRIKEVEIEKMQELDHMKSRFFANISHEFRTPLTLIQGPIEEMERDLPDLPVEKTREFLQFMRRNTQRLQHLIGQILDISKLETGKFKLQVSEGKLEQFVKTIILSFLSLAESKKIRYIYDLHETSHLTFFDRDKLEKILTNLISNAFKFTTEGDKILVSLTFLSASEDITPERVSIKITDTGKGIPREKLDRVFDRFYQVSDSDSRSAEGTGLGLSLTKELVDLYRGEISVDSHEGMGSTFTVKLPVSKKLFTEEERVEERVYQEIKPEKTEPLHKEKELEEIGIEKGYIPETTDNKPVILIVEDNADLRNYIARNLENNYRILHAINGTLGYDLAVDCIPDLIISDVMMPEMDGMEMSRLLKANDSTNHIPVIMLTAKADQESKLEGLETGADDYLIKPFDARELRIKIKNLIEQRRKMRDRYRKEFLLDLKGHENPAPEDDFLARVMDCMEKHMTESEFNVEQLGKELGFSRTQLYRKILALTDHTPSEFIRNIRLRAAARMFNEGHRNITRVLYSVGFNTPAYFAQCFREVYGINPSEYIKKNELTN